MIVNNLDIKEYNPYYRPYIDIATDVDIVKGLKENLDTVVLFYENIPEEKHNYAYADGKWTIKDILLHIIDTERIFAYRALRISRNDLTALAGFEQDDYVANGQANSRSLNSLLIEYKAVRQSTIALYNSFNENILKQIGEASSSKISVRAIGYIISGHENHHNNVIKERYL